VTAYLLTRAAPTSATLAGFSKTKAAAGIFFSETKKTRKNLVGRGRRILPREGFERPHKFPLVKFCSSSMLVDSQHVPGFRLVQGLGEREFHTERTASRDRRPPSSPRSDPIQRDRIDGKVARILKTLLRVRRG